MLIHRVIEKTPWHLCGTAKELIQTFLYPASLNPIKQPLPWGRPPNLVDTDLQLSEKFYKILKTRCKDLCTCGVPQPGQHPLELRFWPDPRRPGPGNEIVRKVAGSLGGARALARGCSAPAHPGTLCLLPLLPLTGYHNTEVERLMPLQLCLPAISQASGAQQSADRCSCCGSSDYQEQLLHPGNECMS